MRAFYRSAVALLVVLCVSFVFAMHTYAQDAGPNNSQLDGVQGEHQSPAITPAETQAIQEEWLRLLATMNIVQPLDIVLVQDETGSMEDDIDSLRALAPQIWDSIAAVTSAEFRMSVVGFRDFSRGDWGKSGDWVYRLLQDFTTSRSEFVSAVQKLSADGGQDGPEAQYAALQYLLRSTNPCIDSNGDGDCLDSNDTLTGQQPSFRTGALRIILLATDAPFHTPGTTPGYPGPNSTAVLDLLRANRVIVIGLVPGGAGKLSQVDELTGATGGSTQSTGGTGQQVANAILAALGEVRPVSAELSSATAFPASVIADGKSSATLVVTLKDTAGKPVAGKVVQFLSSRGADIIEQPLTLTDMDGRAVGTIRSLQTGISLVQAVDVSDNVYVSGRAQVEFGPATVLPNEELRTHIELYNRNITKDFNQLSNIARDAGEDGDAFYRNIGSDTAKLAWDAILGSISFLRLRGELAKPAAEIKSAGMIGYAQGTSWEMAWARIYQLKIYHRVGAMFQEALREAMRNGQWSTITRPMMRDGLNYLAESFADSLGEKIAGDSMEWLIGKISDIPDGMTGLGNLSAEDISVLQNALTTQGNSLLAGIPEMSDAQQRRYAEDLKSRNLASLTIVNSMRHQADLLQNLRQAHDSIGGEGWRYFFLKFGASMLSSVFDGAQLLVDGGITAFETFINAKKLGASTRGYSSSFGIISGASMDAKRLYENGIYGYDRINAGLPAETITGKIVDVRQYSQGAGWGIFWNERNAYADVDIKNTSGHGEWFEIIATYGYNSRLFGLPWAYIPLVKNQTVYIDKNETKTVRIEYKKEEEGGAPEEDRNVTFGVLATNSLGTFSVDYWSDYWSPTRIGFDSRSIMDQAALDAPVIENPIDLYVFSDVKRQQYEAQLWLSNPFTQSIQATITQTLPAGISVLKTDGTVDGDTIVWQTSVAAQDIQSLTFVFAHPAPQGTELTMPPAVMVFEIPVSARSSNATGLSTTSNASTFEAIPRITLDTELPKGEVGVTSTLLVSITNYIDIPLDTTVFMTLTMTADVPVATGQQTVTVVGDSISSLSFQLPSTLSDGIYNIFIRAETREGEPIKWQDAYVVFAAETVPLIEGWNLISVPFTPLKPAAKRIAQLPKDGVDVILSFENGALSFDPSLSNFSTLEMVDGFHSYWIKANAASFIHLQSARYLPLNTPLIMEAGWNLISYLPQHSLSVANALISISGKYDKVLSYDRGATSFYTDIPPQLSTLLTMERGKGYWVHMLEPGVLDYSQAPTATVRSGAAVNQPQQADGIAATNEWINIYSTNSTYNDQSLPIGSIVTAIGEDGRPLGRVTVREEGWYGLLAVYGDDAYTDELDGAQPGEHIRFLINNQPATITNGVDPVWTANGDLTQIDLTAGGPQMDRHLYLPNVGR